MLNRKGTLCMKGTYALPFYSGVYRYEEAMMRDTDELVLLLKIAESTASIVPASYFKVCRLPVCLTAYISVTIRVMAIKFGNSRYCYSTQLNFVSACHHAHHCLR